MVVVKLTPPSTIDFLHGEIIIVMMKDGFEEIWEILREIAIRQKRTEAAIDRLERSQQKTDEQLKKTSIGIDRLQESQKKTDEQLRRTDAEIDKLRKQMGEFTDGWGRFVEGLVEPSVPKVLAQVGFKIIGIDQRPLRRIDGREMEVDLLCIGRRGRRRVVIAVEVKSSFGVRDVRRYLKQLDQFFEFFIDYRGWDLVGMVAGVRWSKPALVLAEREGLYILAPSGETMVLRNRPGFNPRIWRKR